MRSYNEFRKLCGIQLEVYDSASGLIDLVREMKLCGLNMDAISVLCRDGLDVYISKIGRVPDAATGVAKMWGRRSVLNETEQDEVFRHLLTPAIHDSVPQMRRGQSIELCSLNTGVSINANADIILRRRCLMIVLCSRELTRARAARGLVVSEIMDSLPSEDLYAVASLESGMCNGKVW